MLLEKSSGVNRGKKSIIFLLLSFLLTVSANFTPWTNAGPIIINVTDNRVQYPGSEIPKYEKFEITFQVDNSSASNFFFPYDANPPAGLPPGTGITVTALFTPDNWRTTYSQPAFYYQEFLDEIKNNKEWFYPTNSYKWKARFAPHIQGIWQYKLRARDAGGAYETTPQSFTVISSQNKGFIRPSKTDARYFEYDDGTYFPGLGYNLNYRNIDWINPTLANEAMFNIMQQNGIQLTRHWFSQWSIYGEAWSKWDSHNPVHQTQEPRTGIVNPVSSQFDNYPTLSPPSPPAGSEYYLWLEFNETVAGDGTQLRFTPCRVFGMGGAAQVPVKQNTTYRLRVRYHDVGVEGPRIASNPYGFAVKKSGNLLWDTTDETKRCYYPGTGTVLAATYDPPSGESWTHYADPQNPDWFILEGTFNSSANDFLGYLYLTFENVKSTDADQVAGHIFIDQIWIEEDIGSGQYGANLVYKPWMSMHQYINQRDAYAFDKLLSLAQKYDIYFKAVMLEKNDRILQTIDFNGQPLPSGDDVYFYGNGRQLTKVRWLQQAWWRYMQARWGYSPNIHSWELLNEGDPVNTNHWIQTDEFGKYMHCRVFGIDPGGDCTYDHPNDHMVTTSFWGSEYTQRFWGDNVNYPDVDYADRHLYAEESSGNPSFYDSAQFSLDTSYQIGAYQPIGPGKPVMRGEVAWSFIGTNLFEINADGGDWLHDFIWAGINHGGLMEHFFAGGHYTDQIYAKSHDHRPMFGTYFRFIKDVPLNNGRYVDAAPVSSEANLRVLGQKDTTAGNAHLWIQNKNHTWKNVVDGVVIPSLSGTITVGGFTPNTFLEVEWWDTYTGTATTSEIKITDASGNLVLSVSNLITDTAVKISPPGQNNSRNFVPLVWNK